MASNWIPVGVFLFTSNFLIQTLQGCGEGDATATTTTTTTPASCSTPCCQIEPIGGCDLESAMNGYCCEPLHGSSDVVVDGPVYPPDPRFVNEGRPLGNTFVLGLPWADSIFAKTYNESFSNPGYLPGEAEKHWLPNANAYFDAAMKWNRSILVYFPAAFKMTDEGAKVQFIMDGDAFCMPAFMPTLATALENAIAAQQLPAFVLICTASGNQIGGANGGDRLRDFEYQTMSARNAKFFVEDVLPAVEENAEIQAAYPGFKFSTDPKNRATMGCSSSGAASIIASWFAPEYFYRAIGFSATLVQVLSTPCTRDMDFSECESATSETLKEGYPRGAWELHSEQNLIGSLPRKDLRIYHQAGQFDINGCLYYLEHGIIKNCTKQFTQSGLEGFFNIKLANNRTAARLREKGYLTRFVYSLNQSHCSVLLPDPRKGGTSLFDGFVWAWQDEQIEDLVV